MHHCIHTEGILEDSKVGSTGTKHSDSVSNETRFRINILKIVIVI